jgi:F0F1-type ATP synthase assembly protein I
MAPKQPNKFMQFMGIGMQMMATILAGAFLGQYLDKSQHTPSPYYTILCMFVGLSASFYLFFKQITNLNND